MLQNVDIVNLASSNRLKSYCRRILHLLYVGLDNLVEVRAALPSPIGWLKEEGKPRHWRKIGFDLFYAFCCVAPVVIGLELCHSELDFLFLRQFCLQDLHASLLSLAHRVGLLFSERIFLQFILFSFDRVGLHRGVFVEAAVQVIWELVAVEMWLRRGVEPTRAVHENLCGIWISVSVCAWVGSRVRLWVFPAGNSIEVWGRLTLLRERLERPSHWRVEHRLDAVKNVCACWDCVTVCVAEQWQTVEEFIKCLEKSQDLKN